MPETITKVDFQNGTYTFTFSDGVIFAIPYKPTLKTIKNTYDNIKKKFLEVGDPEVLGLEGVEVDSLVSAEQL